MRILDPEVAKERKRGLLSWVIHHYIRTSKPISSQMVAKDAQFKLSSATIRNVLQELENEGYLAQPHASSGRVPTDKGYRFYVDYLMDVQRLASEEKERIQRSYQRHVDELDNLLVQTSRTLSTLSHSAGFVLSPKADAHEVQRLEMLPLGGRRYLILLVSKSGMIRHWPIELPFETDERRIASLNRFLNDFAVGRSIHDVQLEFLRRIEQAEREFQDMSALAKDVLNAVSSLARPDQLYVEGASNIMGAGEVDMQKVRETVHMLEEKKRFSHLLHKQLEDFARKPGAGKKKGKVQVHIGAENMMPELRGLSIIATTYELKDHPAGVLGIVGPKRMHYGKMVALVDFISDTVSRALLDWEAQWGQGHE